MNYDFQKLAHAYRNQPFNFKIKQQAEDFIVSENLGFSPSGSGEHAYLYLEKISCSTLHAREVLARYFKVKLLDVGYSGLKDKHAVTRQWFSIKTNNRCEELCEKFILGHDDSKPSIKILAVTRNARKLKIGSHKTNHFELVLRDVSSPDCASDYDSIATSFDKTLEKIIHSGFPNYFGNQRFGLDASNLDKAMAMFVQGSKCSRDKRGIYLSAAQSYLFNAQLDSRVAEGTWRSYKNGDRFVLAGSKSYFSIDGSSQQEILEASQRIAANDIAVASDLSKLDPSINPMLEVFQQGLRNAKVREMVRPFSVVPTKLEATWDFDQGKPRLSMDFYLPTGSYATALIKELGDIHHH